MVDEEKSYGFQVKIRPIMGLKLQYKCLNGRHHGVKIRPIMGLKCMIDAVKDGIGRVKIRPIMGLKLNQLLEMFHQ